MNDSYIYKKEVDWSLLVDGLTIPVENQIVFGHNMERFLYRGEKKEITIILMGKAYKARIVNVILSYTVFLLRKVLFLLY